MKERLILLFQVWSLYLRYIIFFIIISIPAVGQEKESYQVKTLNEQLLPYKNVSIAFNGQSFIKMGDKGIAFVELSNNDLPIRSIEVSDSQMEAASWNVSKGIIEIIIRKKSYHLNKVVVKDADNTGVKNLNVTFKGRKSLTARTDATGNIEIPLALDEKLISKEQFSVEGYDIEKLIVSENGNFLVVKEVILKDPANEAVTTIKEPVQSTGKSFDPVRLDTISSLTAFYSFIKNYEIEELEEETQQIIDAKFNELVGQLHDSIKGNSALSIRNITDNTYVEDDIKNLLEQAQIESQMLMGQQSDFEEKIKLVNEKLAVGFDNLSENNRKGLLDDLIRLENILAENESRFNASQNNYRNMVNSLMERFFTMEDLENRLSASEAQRLEEQRIFRQRLITVLSIVAVFGVLIILLIYLSNKLNKQKQKLQVANAEVKRVNENLENIVYERTKLLEETNKELDTVLYRASHDLRSPVCSIVGLCNLASTLSNGENNELFERMVQTTEGMDRLLKKLSIISEINQPGNYSTFSLTEVVDSVKSKFKNFIQDYRINFEVKCPENLTIYSNQNLIEVILSNLIENALFYCILTDSRNYKVKFDAAVNNDTLELSIFDNGVGVEANISDKLFEMFYRGNEFSKGNGLGLYIVQKSVQALDGNITVESETGKFSKFVVQLPLQETESQQTVEVTESEPAEALSHKVPEEGEKSKLVDVV